MGKSVHCWPGSQGIARLRRHHETLWPVQVTLALSTSGQKKDGQPLDAG
jgi:hypothetical protein